MRIRTGYWLLIIVAIVGIAAWIDLPNNSGIDIFGFKRDISVHEGLDLLGGMQVLLQAEWPKGTAPNADTLEAAKQIIEQRVNALGVVEPLVQRQGDSRIIVELPGIKDPDKAIAAFGETGLLEFIDAGSTPLPIGSVVTTSLGGPTTPISGTAASGATPSPTPSASPTPEASGTVTSTNTVTPTTTTGSQAASPSQTVYQTVVTGSDLSKSDVTFDQLGAPEVSFSFKSEGAKKFGDFTSANVGKYLAIVVDKHVISCPVIESPITGGSGVIQGVSLDEAQKIVLQLKYGALPVSLQVVQDRTVGPTLGQDSVQKSLVAGAIGLGLVLAFMIVYYRLPGLLADISLLMYTAMVFALFKVIPVTLTLAGIAGFILSIGMAVDANILIFARLKEELRAGHTLAAAVDAGFRHAWPSIRDSNISTIITCLILGWFGSAMGISMITGFAFTLGIGVVVSMFTAITVTRNFLAATQKWLFPAVAKLSPRQRWLFGLDRGSAGTDNAAAGEARPANS
ncbi:MAG: protein translocase subunit SecD [Chloroflexi bacterium]|nr:protein translocase subunit SecD [Chloroflexota bacterium]